MSKYSKDFIDKLAEELMYAKGFDEESKKTSPLEWNLDIDDSQISLCREDVLAVLASYDRVRPIEETTVSYYFNLPPKVKTPNKVKTSAYFTIGVHKDPSISEIREWLDRVDLLGLDEDTKVIGELVLHIDIEDTFLDTAACGDCGANHYVVVNCDH